MVLFVKIIGIFIGCMGLAIMLNPGIMKRMIAYWRHGKRLSVGGLLRVIVGSIFLLAAPLARLPVVIAVFGGLSLVTGTLILVLGPEKTKTMLGWWDQRPPGVLRILGFLIMAIGACVIVSS